MTREEAIKKIEELEETIGLYDERVYLKAALDKINEVKITIPGIYLGNHKLSEERHEEIREIIKMSIFERLDEIDRIIN